MRYLTAKGPVLGGSATPGGPVGGLTYSYYVPDQLTEILLLCNHSLCSYSFLPFWFVRQRRVELLREVFQRFLAGRI